MISLGSGGNRFSNATASPAPNTPSCSIRPTAHPAIPSTGTSPPEAKICTRVILARAIQPPGNQLCPGGIIALMSVIKINAITVDPDSGDELAHRFAARAGAVDDQDGFEGFELLKPTDGRTTWLVVTRWRDEESFQAWMGSPAFRSEEHTSELQSRFDLVC